MAKGLPSLKFLQILLFLFPGLILGWGITDLFDRFFSEKSKIQSFPQKNHEATSNLLSLDEIKAIPSDWEKMLAFKQYVDHLDTSDFAREAQQLQEERLSIFNGNFASAYFYEKWFKHSPEDAVHSALQDTNTDSNQLIIKWLQIDSDTALSYLKSHTSNDDDALIPAENYKDYLLEWICQSPQPALEKIKISEPKPDLYADKKFWLKFISRQPEFVVKNLSSFHLTPDNWDLFATLSYHYTLQDETEAYTWIQSLNDTDELIDMHLKALVIAHPDKRADDFTHLTPQEKENLSQQYLYLQIQRNPLKLFAELDNLNLPIETQSELRTGLVTYAGPRYPNETMDWLATLPPSDEKEQLIQKFFKHQIIIDHKKALDLLGLIKNKELLTSQHQLSLILTQCKKQDPKQFDEWIKKSDLPLKVKIHLINETAPSLFIK